MRLRSFGLVAATWITAYAFSGPPDHKVQSRTLDAGSDQLPPCAVCLLLASYYPKPFADQRLMAGNMSCGWCFQFTMYINQHHLHLPSHRLHIRRYDTLPTGELSDDD